MSLSITSLIEKATTELENSDVFFGHGTDSASGEALSVIEFILNQSIENEQELKQKLTDAQAQKFKHLIGQRIATQKPLAYLLGHCSFAGLDFFVDERVIIPRSPIAELIDRDFDFLPTEPKLVLDLCCGSGCIGLAMAYHLNFQVVMSDVSEKALQVAKINQENITAKARGERRKIHCQLIKSDLFEDIDTQFDLIVSNPPYVSHHQYQQLPDEYHFEPRKALISNDGGLAIANEIMHKSADYLSDDGCLILEVGLNEDKFIDTYKQLEIFWLEFEFGGSGVCAIFKPELLKLKNKGI